MKQCYFLCLILFSSLIVKAQTYYQIVPDTVKVMNGEFVIRNQSKDIHGFLYNIGNGITHFKRLQLQKIGDSAIAIVGQDTLAVGNLGGGVAGEVYFGDPDIALSAAARDASSMELHWWKSDADLYEAPKIGVIGDSQGKGDYPSSYSNSIVGRLQDFIYAVADNAAVFNYCQNGYNSRKLAPNGSNAYVDNQRNITKALSDGNKIILLINTSNDFSSGGAGGIVPIDEVMANTLLIADACKKAGATLFVVSSFPRSQFDSTGRQSLHQMADYLHRKFGNRCAYVYHLIEDTGNADMLNPALQVGDNVHLNDAGCKIVFSAIRDMLTNYFTSNTTVLKYELQSARSINGPFTTLQYIMQPNNPTVVLPKDSNYYRVRIVYKDGYYSKWSNIIEGTAAYQEIPGNKAPLLVVGDFQKLFLPSNSATLTASASDPDGSIASYYWFRVMGGLADITDPFSATTTVTGLTEGTYVFRCKATDNDSLSTYADQVITVVEPDSNNTASKFNFNFTSQNVEGWIDVSGGPLDPINDNKTWTDNIHHVTLVNMSSSTDAWGNLNGDNNSKNDNGEDNPDLGGYPVPVNVIRSGWYSNYKSYVDASSNQMKITGLSPQKKYKLKFYSSLDTRFKLDADPTIIVVKDNLLNSQQVNAVGNTSNVMIFRRVTPNASGEIPFFVGVPAGEARFGMINGLSIQPDSLEGPDAAPVVIIGEDQVIQLPVSSVSLSAAITDPDGEVISCLWTKVSGPSTGTISDPSSPSTIMSGLSAGVYTFRCTASDNDGVAGHADVQVTVNAPSGNPTLYVGVSRDVYTESGWTVLAGGSPHQNVLTANGGTMEGSPITITTVNTANWTPFSGAYTADHTGETTDDGNGFAAPPRVVEGDFFNENSFDIAKPQMEVNGLPAGTYKVTLFGSIEAATASQLNINCETEFRVNDEAPITINTTGNTSQTAVFNGVSVSAGAPLRIYFNPTIGNQHAYVGMFSFFIVEKTN